VDARLTELEFLAKIARQSLLEVGPLTGADRDLVAFLASRGYVNDLIFHGRAKIHRQLDYRERVNWSDYFTNRRSTH
jgi:hypothetical protein